MSIVQAVWMHEVLGLCMQLTFEQSISKPPAVTYIAKSLLLSPVLGGLKQKHGWN